MHPMEWDEGGVCSWVLQELPLRAANIIPEFHAHAVDGAKLWYLGQDSIQNLNLRQEDMDALCALLGTLRIAAESDEILHVLATQDAFVEAEEQDADFQTALALQREEWDEIKSTIADETYSRRVNEALTKISREEEVNFMFAKQLQDEERRATICLQKDGQRLETLTLALRLEQERLDSEFAQRLSGVVNNNTPAAAGVRQLEGEMAPRLEELLQTGITNEEEHDVGASLTGRSQAKSEDATAEDLTGKSKEDTAKGWDERATDSITTASETESWGVFWGVGEDSEAGMEPSEDSSTSPAVWEVELSPRFNSVVLRRQALEEGAAGAAASGVPLEQGGARDDGAREAGSSGGAAQAELGEKAECVSCGERSRLVQRLECEHGMCDGCLKRLLRMALHDRTLFPASCCGVRLPGHLATRVLEARELVTVAARMKEYEAEDYMYCPRPRCSAFLALDALLKARREIDCVACGVTLCVACKSEAHPGLTCQERQEVGDGQLVETAREAGWRLCRQCRTFVSLHHGCNHITCACGHHFCYACGEPWVTGENGRFKQSCGCPLWEEQRLLREEERRVEQNVEVQRQVLRRALRPQEVEAVRQRVHHALEREEEEGECEHEEREHVHGNFGFCRRCSYNLPVYAFQCQHCLDVFCQTCHHHRMGRRRFF